MSVFNLFKNMNVYFQVLMTLSVHNNRTYFTMHKNKIYWPVLLIYQKSISTYFRTGIIFLKLPQALAFVLVSVSKQQLIMDEALTRFPHLGDRIFKKLDSKSLINCKEVNRTFKNFMKVEKKSYLRVIQWYTNCSKSLMRKIVEKSGAAIIILSILREIYGYFPTGTKQHRKYLNKWGSISLHLAAESGQLGAYHLIMENVANKNPFKRVPGTMSCTYIKREYEYRFEFTTPLHLAAKNGNLSVCKLIIDNIVDKNPPAWGHKVQMALSDQLTPLHLAANNGHFSVCELIINNTLLKNPKDQHGWTPLHFAAQNGHLRVCKLIWSNFGKSNAYSCDPYDNFGNTPFKLATQFGHEEVKTAILEFIRSAQKRTEETTDNCIKKK